MIKKEINLSYKDAVCLLEKAIDNIGTSKSIVTGIKEFSECRYINIMYSIGTGESSKHITFWISKEGIVEISLHSNSLGTINLADDIFEELLTRIKENYYSWMNETLKEFMYEET